MKEPDYSIDHWRDVSSRTKDFFVRSGLKITSRSFARLKFYSKYEVHGQIKDNALLIDTKRHNALLLILTDNQVYDILPFDQILTVWEYDV